MAVSRPAGGGGGPLVLIGFAEALAAIETAWSLQRAGLRVAAFRRAASRPALRRVRGVEVHDVPAPEADAAATVAALRYEVNGRIERPTGVICADGAELRRAAAMRWPGPVLMQPLIHGVGEGLFGHAGPRGVLGWSAHRRVRMVNPQGSASSACRSEPVDPELAEAGERFLRAIGWRGMFMLEFLRDADGKPWFMELNGRAWGSMALARRRGFEYPAWTVRATLDPAFEPAPPPDPPEIRCRNLGLELVHLMFVARGPQSGAPMAWPRLGRSVREVCTFARGDRLYNWARSQPDVLVADTWGTLRQYTRKMVRKRR